MNQEDVFQYLKENGPGTVCEIANGMGATKANVYTRLNKLKKYGLVEKVEKNRSESVWRAVHE